MARWAIVDTITSTVRTTIVADPDFIAARYPRGTLVAVRYEDPARPDPEAEVTSRAIEPGAALDVATKVITRAARGTEPQSIDDRIAALEAAVAAKAVR